MSLILIFIIFFKFLRTKGFFKYYFSLLDVFIVIINIYSLTIYS